MRIERIDTTVSPAGLQADQKTGSHAAKHDRMTPIDADLLNTQSPKLLAEGSLMTSLTSRHRSRRRRLRGTLAIISIVPALPMLALLEPITAPVAQAASGVCIGKQTTVSGHKAIINCGPATATLVIGGTTHTFSGGTCIGGGSVLTLDLGEFVTKVGPANAGKSSFSIIVDGKTADVVAAAGGHDLVKGGITMAEVPRGAATKGAFHGKLITNLEPFTGSWNCHGAIVHSSL
jgi:hypothetical protein